MWKLVLHATPDACLLCKKTGFLSLLYRLLKKKKLYFSEMCLTIPTFPSIRDVTFSLNRAVARGL